MSRCSVDGCVKPVKTRGWCGSHYMRWWSTGDIRADTPLGSIGSTSRPHCRACEVNPWFHRAPRYPRGHGPDLVLLVTTRDGVELWNCIEPECSGQSFVAEVAEEESAA